MLNYRVGGDSGGQQGHWGRRGRRAVEVRAEAAEEARPVAARGRGLEQLVELKIPVVGDGRETRCSGERRKDALKDEELAAPLACRAALRAHQAFDSSGDGKAGGPGLSVPERRARR